MAKKESKGKKVSKASSKSVKAIQPEVNIGLIGHVDHGKTTLTERLSGKWTDTHSEELKRGITIRLGYADCVFYKCPKCKGMKAYTTNAICPHCKAKCNFLRKISFVDAPGHESLMATMLSGATIMDGALLLVAANEDCPQPQTREHLMALEIMGLKNLIVVQNKIDIVSKEKAMENYKQIKEFLKGTVYEKAVIIPISAQQRANVDILIEAMEKFIPTPKRSIEKDPLMFIARSFDINKPGSDPLKMIGGVLGGALFRGKLKVGDELEIKPGQIYEEKNQQKWKPITTKIVGLRTGGSAIDEVVPGGSIGVLTELDPSIVKSDSLTGNVAGHKGKLPDVLSEFKLEVHLFDRVVGTKDELKVNPLKLRETLMLNVNSAATVGIVTKIKKKVAHCILKRPVCVGYGARITISRLVGQRFRLIGYGVLKE